MPNNLTRAAALEALKNKLERIASCTENTEGASYCAMLGQEAIALLPHLEPAVVAVPDEPTEEMCFAAATIGWSAAEARECWIAMNAAATPHPTVQAVRDDLAKVESMLLLCGEEECRNVEGLPQKLRSLIDGVIHLRRELAIKTARSAAVQAVRWQNINTAPRDGSLVILGRFTVDEDGEPIRLVTMGRWIEALEDGYDDMGHYMGHDAGFQDCEVQNLFPGRSIGAEDTRYTGVQPTHWMTDPPAPDTVGDP